MSSRRHYQTVVAITAFICFVYLFSSHLTAPEALAPPLSPLTSKPIPTHKYAYCTFLAPSAKGTGQTTGIDLDAEDHYLVGTRMLIYQLLYDPITKTTNNYPLIVLVTTDVPQHNRDRLTRDGAIVIEVSPLKFDWIVPGRERWAQVMDKLHVFELVQYEKILLLDSDHAIVRPLDDIFDDPAAQIVENLGDPEKMKDDEATQPISYIMAGNSGPLVVDHPYPASRGNRLNAGFVILKPSIEMYKHYVSVASIEGRFPGGSPEQDLWNYVHSRNGNMPWKQVDPDWTANTPIFNDYKHGIASFHEKYWSCDRDRKLRDVLVRIRWKMEGFLDARDALTPV
ncbi:nucleotide-diphospho-sugar transferase [Hyaloscypha sp. PMI_1271]|nr:nucleotide-diphospho-sugar transferase [Hyaloscypha sp. PMI_1271]